MKKIRLLLALLPLFSLTSCLEIAEDITVNENGSGEYLVKADAGEMMSLLMSMSGDKNPETAEKMKEVKDTSFALLSTLKAGETATPEELELLRNSTMHLKMDLENSVFIMESKHIFSSADKFAKLKEALASFNKKADNPFSRMMGGNSGEDDGEEKDNPFSGLGGLSGDGFDLVLSNTAVTRTVNAEKLNELKNTPGMEEIDEQGRMLFEAIKYKTVFHLPRPATVQDSKIMVVSDDRKTVSFENNLLQLFDEPKAFAFTINY